MLRNKKGIALLMVVGLIIMLLVLGGATLVISVGHFGTSHGQLERSRAFYAAEAALQRALWKCRTGGYGDLSTIPSGGSISPETITITDETYSFPVNITIYAAGEQGATSGTYRLDATILDY